MFVANRAAANEVRGGGELEKYGAGHGKNGKKESMKVSGAKRPPLFRRRLFFFLLHPSLPSGTIFLFLGLGTWMDLNVLRFGFNL